MSNVFHLFKIKDKNIESSKNSTQELDVSRQMSLPFSAPHTLYILTGDVEATGDDFFHFATQKNIAAFFDLRLSPRLDFLAPTRQKAFSQLQNMGVAYFDVFGRFGVSSLSSALDECFEISKEIIAATSDILKNGEPFLMAFDNAPLVIEYSKLMNRVFDVQEIRGKFIKDAAAEFKRLKM